MKNILIFMFFIIFIQNAVASEGVVYEKYSKSSDPNNFSMEYKTPQEAYWAITKKTSVRKFEMGDIVGYPDFETAIIWIFTQPHNPAHPAVMKLRAFGSKKSVYVRTKVLCGGSKIDCDKFYSYRTELDRSVTALYHKVYSTTPDAQSASGAP